ncbi:hypothetical protein DIPPA_12393 [Diplonema papillatum]|nr:hypothetical protein DIPPA_12393 [Diplonema papillatum]
MGSDVTLSASEVDASLSASPPREGTLAWPCGQCSQHGRCCRNAFVATTSPFSGST